MKLANIGIVLAAAGCVHASPTGTVRPAEPINTVEAEVSPDRVADSLLIDVRDLEPEIVVDMRYATANNFTGAPLPGYLANRAYLRREAAAALARVQSNLRQRGLGLKIFDAYRPARATQAMGSAAFACARPVSEAKKLNAGKSRSLP